jgi:hypothetical protein
MEIIEIMRIVIEMIKMIIIEKIITRIEKMTMKIEKRMIITETMNNKMKIHKKNRMMQKIIIIIMRIQIMQQL